MKLSLCTIFDDQLIILYTVEQLSPLEIANKYSIPYRSIVRKLKKLGIFKIKKNDKNKEKYNKNHTEDSYKKMRETIKQQYVNGRVVWNKNVKEDENISVKRQADNLRNNHHNNAHGKNNTMWNGGATGHVLARILKKDILKCELCESTNNLEVHHKDKNPMNNELNNIIKVCCKCHHKFHPKNKDIQWE